MLPFCLAEHLFFFSLFVLVVWVFFVCFYTEMDFFSLLATFGFFLDQEVQTFPLGLGSASLCLFLKDLSFCCIYCQGRKNSSEYSLPRRAENRQILQHSSETLVADHQEMLSTSGMIQYDDCCVLVEFSDLQESLPIPVGFRDMLLTIVGKMNTCKLVDPPFLLLLDHF